MHLRDFGRLPNEKTTVFYNAPRHRIRVFEEKEEGLKKSC